MIEKYFNKNSVIVYGKKGKGKDLLFQYVINKRKTDYYANLDYGGKFHEIKIADMKFGDNTFENILDNDFKKCKKEFKEKTDFYISDAGSFLPSQYNSILDKKYKGLPLFYALTRHAYNSNIHVNTQYLGRVWNKIREQADLYIHARGVIKFIPFILIGKVTIYSKYQSALNEVEPLTKKANKYQKMDYAIFNSKNGYIKNKLYIIRKSKIYYNSRYFHEKLFGKKAPKERNFLSALFYRILHKIKRSRDKQAKASDTP